MRLMIGMQAIAGRRATEMNLERRDRRDNPCQGGAGQGIVGQ
jgi:hypothetical protein